MILFEIGVAKPFHWFGGRTLGVPTLWVLGLTRVYDCVKMEQVFGYFPKLGVPCWGSP